MAKTLGKEGNDVKKKGLALVLALTLLVVSAVAGTLAWLTAKSDTVVNTFTTSDITVKLEETKGTTTAGGKEFKMIPGYDIAKDPKAWVVKGSEDCYLFVKLDWANNTYTSGEATKSYLTWAIADGWTRLAQDKDGKPITDLVYYRTVTSTQMSGDDGKTNAFPVLAGNKVTVSGEITKTQMNAFTTANLPKLTITAYASQYYKSAGVKFEPAEAWANVTP